MFRNLFLQFSVICFSLMLSGAALATSPEQKPETLPDLERERISYGLSVVSQLEKIWPLTSHKKACLILFGQTSQWLLNCENPYPGLKLVPEQLFAGQSVYWSNQPLILPHAHLPYDQAASKIVGQALVYPNRPEFAAYRQQPWLLIQQLDDLRMNHPAFTDSDTQEWLSIMVHELFHALFQMPEASIVAELAKAEQQPNRFVTQEPLKALYNHNPELQKLLKQEHQLLANALSQPELSPNKARQVLQEWLKLYQQRLNLCSSCLDGQYRHWDAFWTFLEGAARYVESKLLLDPVLQGNVSQINQTDPLFNAFATTRGKGYAALPESNRAIGQTYYYAIGMHLAFVLDQIDRKWPQRVFLQPNWLIGLAESEASKAVD